VRKPYWSLIQIGLGGRGLIYPPRLWHPLKTEQSQPTHSACNAPERKKALTFLKPTSHERHPPSAAPPPPPLLVEDIPPSYSSRPHLPYPVTIIPRRVDETTQPDPPRSPPNRKLKPPALARHPPAIEPPSSIPLNHPHHQHTVEPTPTSCPIEPPCLSPSPTPPPQQKHDRQTTGGAVRVSWK
jgi:hypothetical protein